MPTKTSHATAGRTASRRRTSWPLAVVVGVPLGLLLYTWASVGSYNWFYSIGRFELYAGMLASSLAATMGAFLGASWPRTGLVTGTTAAVILMGALVAELIVGPDIASGASSVLRPALAHGGTSAVTGAVVCATLVCSAVCARDRHR